MKTFLHKASFLLTIGLLPQAATAGIDIQKATRHSEPDGTLYALWCIAIVLPFLIIFIGSVLLNLARSSKSGKAGALIILPGAALGLFPGRVLAGLPGQGTSGMPATEGGSHYVLMFVIGLELTLIFLLLFLIGKQIRALKGHS